MQFTYPLRKDSPVFQDLNLTLPQGSVTALIGRRCSSLISVFSYQSLPRQFLPCTHVVTKILAEGDLEANNYHT